jgi:hypothetical protein
MRDIPIYSKLKGSVVEVEMPNDGFAHMVVTDARRGAGKRLYCLQVEGILPEGDYLHSQCYVQFNGQRYGGSFREVLWRRNEQMKVAFETIISDPGYWS